MILNLAEGQGKTKITYSGNHTTKTITVSGAQYTLYTITGSGTLTVKGKCTMDIWCSGGGANGQKGYGGGGGYFAQANAKTLAAGDYSITVGAAQGATSIKKGNDTVLTAAGATNQNGASGGGSYSKCNAGPPGNYSTPQTPGTGGGASTRPFGDNVNFTSLPCAGGGGAGNYDTYEDDSGFWSAYGGNGGAGGSNGGNGGNSTTKNNTTDVSAGAGGTTGGGTGGKVNAAGSAATYYGSGGGGSMNSTKIGAGYQGVVFIRVPIKATPAPSGSYTYYRLNMTGMMRDSASGTFFSVAELKLYNGSTAVSYTGATFTASSSLSGYPVAQAFDGNASTIWLVDGSPTSAWIQVQLSSAAKVTSFSITARSDQNDRLNAFTLQGSNDGSSWTTLYTGSNTASGWAQGGTKTFTI